MVEWTTTAIEKKDLEYLRAMKKRKGIISVKVLISKMVKLIKRLKLEEELR